METLIQCVSSFFACLGFCFIFRIHHHFKFVICGSLLGSLGWYIYLSLQPIHNVFIQNFIAMLIITLLAEIMARIYKAPATIFIIIGFLPLVPGNGIYNTMLYAVQGQNDLFIKSFLSTIGISISLALAILVASTFLQIYKVIKTKQFISPE